MSTFGSDEQETPADHLNIALVAFTGCIGSALEGICSYGLTMGASYVPFNPDPDSECDEDAVACSQAWVRVMGIDIAYSGEGFGGDCGGTRRLDLEVGVLRCVDIPEGGEAPTETDVMVAAMQAMTDMNALYCAAMSCDVWDSIEAGQWQPDGPRGGQYGGTWVFTVEI